MSGPRQIKPYGILDMIGCVGVQDSLPARLRVSTLAGAYLIEWKPMLAGVLILYYANRRQV